MVRPEKVDVVAARNRRKEISSKPNAKPDKEEERRRRREEAVVLEKPDGETDLIDSIRISTGFVFLPLSYFFSRFPFFSNSSLEWFQRKGHVIGGDGWTFAIQSLPIGNPAVIGGDGWTSALAEVPVIVGSNGNTTSVLQPASIPATTSITGGRNMAETLAHGPPRTQAAPQVA